MKIWTIRTDDNCSDQLTVFTYEVAADQAALTWCQAHWLKEEPCPDDWQSAYDQIGDCEDFMSCDEHELDDTNAIQTVIISAKAQLNDLIEQITQMRVMFRDDDGRIQQAIDDAESWPKVSETAA
ncbi:hypothetical protein [Yoonia sp. R2-816]|uniref:hypothetical protein n=1 Tax=Yoonia sp. R2-816 TaxID=3342638 RepID=UPI0037286FAD